MKKRMIRTLLTLCCCVIVLFLFNSCITEPAETGGGQTDAGTECQHEIETLSAKAATCVETGLTEGARCKICGEVVTAQQVLSTVDHVYENGRCKICGNSDGLPAKVDLGGYTYNAYILSNNTGSGSFWTEDFWIDPETGAGDVLEYAVIKRNAQIEKDFHCTIHATNSTRSSQYEELKNYYDADQTFDLAILKARDAALCATDGLLSDLNGETNQKHLNLKHQAFDQNAVEQLTLGTKLYYVSGDMNISTMDTTMATIFNTALFADNKDKIVEELGNEMYGDLYQMLDDGKWTTENMLKIANVVLHDEKTDDGTLRHDKGDVIGYFQYSIGPLYYYYGTGMRITENVEGYPAFDILSEEGKAAYNYVFETFNVNFNADTPRGASSERAQNFHAGAVLFADYLLWDVRRVLYAAESEIPYGILPLSTREENADHLSLVYFSTLAQLWTIPAKMQSTENAPLLMQVMATYSSLEGSTFDAYCEKNMYYSDDKNARESLQIIRDNLVYDTAMMYDWGNFITLLLNAGLSEGREYDTYTTEEALKAAEEALQSDIDLFYALNQ